DHGEGPRRAGRPAGPDAVPAEPRSRAAGRHRVGGAVAAVRPPPRGRAQEPAAVGAAPGARAAPGRRGAAPARRGRGRRRGGAPPPRGRHARGGPGQRGVRHRPADRGVHRDRRGRAAREHQPVFINLSWRSQSLLHRQLRLLDQMERRASSPEELDDLFRLDHLTTRMRRHAEGLVILAGSPTVRAWDHPVPAEDVVRAAIAEVEDYTRVEVAGASSAAVIGAVVADVIHLLAELIENAASFSPPTTEVTVKVETVANGLAVEVVDRGIGLSKEERDELNRRLASAVEFDLADTERLGLFVVARLAARHGIEVSLQPSVYGGTTAVVLIPHTLVVLEDEWRLDDGERWPQPVAAAAGGPLRLGRAARTALPALPAARDGGRPAATPPAGSRPHGGGKAADGPAPHPRDGAASDGDADEAENADHEDPRRLPPRVRSLHLEAPRG